MWTDLYAPSTLSDMLLNCPDIEDLVLWLSSWDSDAKGSDAICVDNDDSGDGSSWNQSARRVERNSHRPRNLDFCYSDDSADSSTSVKPWRSTAFLVLGPSGCGKTALVYALATKLAFKVDVLFESDRGFWSAVGSLLQMGRRPILMTASDPSVVDTIPIPFRVCNMRPLKIVCSS
ncbi:unnamed protein product [Dibothriocephalus latus]|uniref:ATPase AAA-type core domain-containing protein n=1 Tax=Dibothriocephalus latus TaxID=60516 RepID=A0A3P7M2R9_DIBLA|nr:unnamed protein product [Dibothriocephalus latus]